MVPDTTERYNRIYTLIENVVDPEHTGPDLHLQIARAAHGVLELVGAYGTCEEVAPGRNERPARGLLTGASER
ncbi:MAG TPA: hypothetical protein VNG12_00130 [Acidimicrobiales bacterium]|nr:hypothetical protein [Acidimicrobiales bacterium]